MSQAELLPITPICEAVGRKRVRLSGRVRSIRIRPWADTPTLEVILVDDTGGLALVFQSRRRIPGITLGTAMTADGMLGAHQRRLAMLNPSYELHANGS